MTGLIGQGAIAKRFIRYAHQSEFLIFAGEVHDSAISDEKLLVQEEHLIEKTISELDKNSIFVYFSSCSLDDPCRSGSLYCKHKFRMEEKISQSGVRHMIFRLPQLIAGGDTSNSLIEYLVDCVFRDKHFELWDGAFRNFIDLDDVYLVISDILDKKQWLNQIVNVAAPNNTKVIDLVMLIEQIFQKEAHYELVKKAAAELAFDWKIDIEKITASISILSIEFGPEYLENSIRKYYQHLINRPPLISIIVPTYNQERGINEFYKRTKTVLTQLTPRFEHEIIFVNDGSRDATFEKIRKLSHQDPKVLGVNLSRNFGNQLAITAGVHYCMGDLAVIIDDDLQDPPEIILDFIPKWFAGYKVVYGVRPNRKGVGPIFNATSRLFYHAMSWLSDISIPKYTGDFRLIDRVVIDQLRQMKEENRYYRGMVSWVGFRQTGVFYERDKRYQGSSNFSLAKYANFALNGLTSFTDKPLYLSSMLGFSIMAISSILGLYLFGYKIIHPEISIRGWTSLTLIITFFGGIQLFSIGVLGIYISKIYREVKGRPLFVVGELVNIKDRQIDN